MDSQNEISSDKDISAIQKSIDLLNSKIKTTSVQDQGATSFVVDMIKQSYETKESFFKLQIEELKKQIEKLEEELDELEDLLDEKDDTIKKLVEAGEGTSNQLGQMLMGIVAKYAQGKKEGE